MIFFLNDTDLCSVPGSIPLFIQENNNIGDVITTLNAEDGVTAVITSQDPEGFFSLSGNNLIAETVLDYEVNIVYLIKCLVLCSANTL